MDFTVKRIFLVLVVAQALHSVEEYMGKLWESFPPATFLCSLISDDLETGFLFINIGLFVFGLWCWFFPIRRNYQYATILIWFWIIIETINGIGHPIWSFIQKTYTPGLITSPILLYLAIILFRRQKNTV